MAGLISHLLLSQVALIDQPIKNSECFPDTAFTEQLGKSCHLFLLNLASKNYATPSAISQIKKTGALQQNFKFNTLV
jgi:hypothetical protein